MGMLSFGSVYGILFWTIAFACAVWLIYDVLMVNKKLSDTAKIIWIIIAIPFSIIASIIYWLMYKK